VHIITANTQGNPNIGLYCYATEEYCIVGPEAANLKDSIQEALQVKTIITTIAGTSLAGVFCVGNSKTLLVPSIAFEHEIKKLQEAGLNVKVFDTNNTALGNNLVANDHGALIGPMFNQQEQSELAKLLGVPVHQFSIAGVDVVGSSLVITERGALIHRDASRFEQDMAVDTLRLQKIEPGTVNFGVPYVRGGIIANSKGFLIGSTSGGPEISHADEALGFLEDV
jgi:translation initiation factor 6